MATIKAYSDLQQSKKLAEILPLESADMYWFRDDTETPKIYPKNMMKDSVSVTLPCWSLSALLGVLPEWIIENYYAPNLQKENGKYSIAYGNDELLCIASNPVDAVYELVLKLNELKML